VYVVLGALLKGIFVLRFHETAEWQWHPARQRQCDDTEVPAARLCCRRTISRPSSQAVWEWPILTSHQQERAIPVLRVHGNAFLLASLCGDISSTLGVLREFAAERDIVQVRADFRQCGHVELSGCTDERVCRLLRSVKESRPFT
jgi:hypothetical protein